jgi:hypothetical protein
MQQPGKMRKAALKLAVADELPTRESVKAYFENYGRVEELHYEMNQMTHQ